MQVGAYTVLLVLLFTVPRLIHYFTIRRHAPEVHEWRRLAALDRLSGQRAGMPSGPPLLHHYE